MLEVLEIIFPATVTFEITKLCVIFKNQSMVQTRLRRDGMGERTLEGK